jgi:hypothetical protein
MTILLACQFTGLPSNNKVAETSECFHGYPEKARMLYTIIFEVTLLVVLAVGTFGGRNPFFSAPVGPNVTESS